MFRGFTEDTKVSVRAEDTVEERQQWDGQQSAGLDPQGVTRLPALLQTTRSMLESSGGFGMCLIVAFLSHLGEALAAEFLAAGITLALIVVSIL